MQVPDIVSSIFIYDYADDAHSTDMLVRKEAELPPGRRVAAFSMARLSFRFAASFPWPMMFWTIILLRRFFRHACSRRCSQQQSGAGHRSAITAARARARWTGQHDAHRRITADTSCARKIARARRGAIYCKRRRFPQVTWSRECPADSPMAPHLRMSKDARAAAKRRRRCIFLSYALP